MKSIIAIIKPYKLDDVRNALTGIGISTDSRKAIPKSIVAPNTR